MNIDKRWLRKPSPSLYKVALSLAEVEEWEEDEWRHLTRIIALYEHDNAYFGDRDERYPPYVV